MQIIVMLWLKKQGYLVKHNKQGNQRWQIPRPPHASAWQRSPH